MKIKQGDAMAGRCVFVSLAEKLLSALKWVTVCHITVRWIAFRRFDMMKLVFYSFILFIPGQEKYCILVVMNDSN